MGLVWPAYLNASTIELRSSIPVHITQGSDKPPPSPPLPPPSGERGRQRVGEERMKMRGWVYFGQGLKSISSVFSITEDGIYGDTVHFFFFFLHQ